MRAIPLTDELRPIVPTNGDVIKVQDAGGQTVAVVMSQDEYDRLVYDMDHPLFSEAEVEAQIARSQEQIRRGEYVTSDQLFEELRQRGFMPREAS